MRPASQCKELARCDRNGSRSNCLTSTREIFGHWKVTGGLDVFAFRHPSLAQTDVRDLLESEAHHHKVCPVGAGRLIAMVGITPTDDPSTRMLQVLFGLVLTITPRTSTNKNELPAARIHRQCNPRSVEVAFLTLAATVSSLQKTSSKYYKVGA